jgi:hypothetical protein
MTTPNPDTATQENFIGPPTKAQASFRAWQEKDRAQQEKERTEQAEEEKREQARQKLYISALTDMFRMSLEHKANAQISLLTHGMMECMNEASIMSPQDAPAAAPNVRKTPDARTSLRHTELSDMARLSEASARMFDAYTRFRRANNHDLQFQRITRRKMKDGTVQQTMIRHLGRNTPMDDFEVSNEDLAAARKRGDEKAARESAES